VLRLNVVRWKLSPAWACAVIWLWTLFQIFQVLECLLAKERITESREAFNITPEYGRQPVSEIRSSRVGAVRINLRLLGEDFTVKMRVVVPFGLVTCTGAQLTVGSIGWTSNSIYDPWLCIDGFAALGEPASAWIVVLVLDKTCAWAFLSPDSGKIWVVLPVFCVSAHILKLEGLSCLHKHRQGFLIGINVEGNGCLRELPLLSQSAKHTARTNERPTVLS
jgi:hypothetical protein